MSTFRPENILSTGIQFKSDAFVVIIKTSWNASVLDALESGCINVLESQKVDYKLYAPDGTIYKTIKINIPNKSKDYLSRAYKNWETVKKPGHVHSDYYDMLF